MSLGEECSDTSDVDVEKLSINSSFIHEDVHVDDTCLFDSDDFISKPIKSESCTIDGNIIQLHHSFGYDCFSKMFNICAADEHTVMYAAGSYISMLDINNGSLSFRKCAGNGGIGHITKNPVSSHIAVGEKCNDPLIMVYEWPTFQVISVLKGSTKKQINWLNYSENGEYLCSQGGEPDYNLTIWDWKTSKIVLRTKSHTQDVYICKFSTFIPQHIVTAGSGHIKFWKMANTFTGLKLKGQLGRFGKTEISNVIGIFSMPNEKVISGCEWGNILVWDEELIDVQVTRKGRQPCHLAPIIMFLYSEQNMKLTSISMDGMIKFWNYRTVDLADPPENDRILEIEPSFTIKVQDSINDAKIMGMCKINGDSNSQDYFIQDGNGGLWLADMKTAETADAKPPKRLAKFHGDTITSLLASPVGYFIATTSLDGWFHVYDVVNKVLIFMQDLKESITSLVWLPLRIASSGNCFVIGFRTGILKIVSVPLKENMEGVPMSLTEIQSSKPHTDSISHLTVNHSGNILVCGSDDSSIFAYKIETKPIKLNPIGIFPLPGKVTFIHWKTSEKQTILISCASGHIVEVKIPPGRPSYTKESFLLNLESRVIKTVSIKSEIIRNQYLSDVEHKKKKKVDQKKENIAAMKAENPGVEIDEELYLEDSDEDEEPPKIYIPPVPNPVLFAVYSPSENTVWASVDGYDAGYLYEYDFDVSKPINAMPIWDKNNIPLTAIKITRLADSLRILMGFDDGRVRVTNFKVDDPSDLSDYIEYSIHDNKTGRVKILCLSEDNRMLFTCGDDGNIFSFTFQCDNSAVEKCVISTSKLPKSTKLLEKDIIKIKEDLKMSLEERKIVKEKRKALYLANKEKEKLSCLLYCLREKFKLVLISNQALPESIRFSDDYFQFDERINRSLIKEAQSEMDQLKLELAFDYEKSALGLKKVKNYFIDEVITTEFEVKAILTNMAVKTIYHTERRNIFGSLLEEFLSKKRPKRQRRKSTAVDRSTGSQHNVVTEKEVFLRNVHEMYQSLPKKIQVAIDKFTARSDFETTKILKIKKMHDEKTHFSNIEEEATLNHAQETIGDFTLKTSSNFIPIDDEVVYMEDKFDQYTEVQEEMSNLKSTFNEKVFDLRQSKIKLINDYKQFKFDVNIIQNELNDPEVITPLDFPEVVVDESIDPNLVDSFELDRYKDLMYWDHLENNYLYSETSEKEFSYEEPSCLDIKIKEMKKEELKYRHLCLHESMLTRINMFDCHVSTLNDLRRDIELHVTFLDLFAIKLEEELIILNEFDLIEDEYLYNIFVKTGIQNNKADQIKNIREDIAYYKSIIEKKSNQLIDIEYLFDVEIRNNDFAKHLKKIFKKKLKMPKMKTDDDDESLSSSSSDDSDSSSDSESLKSIESLMDTNQLAMFDENILPEGCDPKLFNLTFELRSKRHEIEQYIESVNKKVELSNTNFNSAYAEFEIIENDLKQTLSELEAYQIKKQLALNDVEATVVLRVSQMTKAKMLKKAILVHGNLMQDLAKRVTEIKIESEAIKNDYEEEKLLARHLRAEVITLKNTIQKYKLDIKDEMIKKFKIEKNWKFLDDMEMTIINYMIILAKSSVEKTKARYTKEINMIKRQIRAHQEILIDVLGSSTVKTMILRAFYKGIAQIQQSLSIQQKSNEKVRSLSVNCGTSDVASLEEIYEQLSKQRIDIGKKIKAIKKCEIYLELFKCIFHDKNTTACCP